MEFGTSPQGIQYVVVDGHRRFLGCQAKARKSAFPRFASSDVIPMSEWKPVDMEPYLVGIKDQDGYNACVGHGCTSAMEVRRNLSGQGRLALSAWFTYSLVDGGVDQGAQVSAVLETMGKYGVCEESLVPYGTYRQKQIPQTAWDDGIRNKLEQGEEISSFLELGSALQRWRPVAFGAAIGRNFEPDSKGFIPSWDGRVAGGHCMAALGLVNINGKWWVKVANSWSTRWGLNGWCYLDQSYFDQRGWSLDAYSLFRCSVDPKTPQIPNAIAA